MKVESIGESTENSRAQGAVSVAHEVQGLVQKPHPLIVYNPGFDTRVRIAQRRLTELLGR
ncbi:MAG: hypothetical protein ACREU7_16495 [Burkholderiales bacterium]